MGWRNLFKAAEKVPPVHMHRVYLEEPIGYPANTGFISPSVCPFICPLVCLSIHLSARPSVRLEYKSTKILNKGIEIRVHTWSFLSVVHLLWINIPMCEKIIWVQPENW